MSDVLAESRPGDEILLGFTRAVRAAGLVVTPDRAQAFLTALSHMGTGRSATRCAGHATLCSSPEDRALHDQVFDVYFGCLDTAHRQGASAEVSRQLGLEEPQGHSASGDEATDEVPAVASHMEVLRNRDFAALSQADQVLLRKLFAELEVKAPRRRVARRYPHRRGELDARRTVRASLHAFGEPTPVRFRRRGSKPRRVVLLMDVSGSMAPYAEGVVRLAHRMSQALPGLVDAYTLGTRVTRVTAALLPRDAERALAAVGSAVPDWSGGTRLGDGFRQFLEGWGRGGAARGSILVVFSDGWERGDTTELSELVDRMHRLAHALIWVNPHRGKDGYLPIQQGIVAVLPHIDALVAGHSIGAYGELLELIARS